MKTILTYILLLVLCIYSVQANSQTPYDSFAPEISRPMLDIDFIRARDAYHAQQAITTDTLLYIVDMCDGSIIDTISLTDELRKWLSVDPLADKYSNISPYAYCGWNPIKFVDPDGRYFDETNEETAQKIEAELFTKKIYAALGNNNQMRELYSTWKDIQDMRNDPHHDFRFESISASESDPVTQYGGTKSNGDQIINMYSCIEKLDGTTAHEARHGGQIARGEIFYDEMGYSWNYGVRKEVDASRAQWAWEGKLELYIDKGALFPFPTFINYSEINNNLINKICLDPYGVRYLYSPQNVDIESWNNH